MSTDGEWRYQLADVVFAIALTVLVAKSALGVLNVAGNALFGPALPAYDYQQERGSAGGDYDWPTP